MEMENRKSQKIMLHYNVHYIHCSTCAPIVSVLLFLACSFVLTVHFFHNHTLLRCEYMPNI